MERAAVNGIREHQAKPIRIAASDGHIAEQHLSLNAAGQMHQMNLAARVARRRGRDERQRPRSLPVAKDFFNLREHGVSGKNRPRR